MILLIGAPGNIGTAAAAALLARVGRDGLRAGAVYDAAATALRELGLTDVVRADLRDPASLDRAFPGVERLVLITPFVPDQADLEIAALDAAARAGVERVVKLSPTHADRDRYPVTPANSTPHVVSEAHAARLGLPLTIVRAEAFTSNLLAQVPAIAGGLLVYPGGDAGMTWTDPRDIGDAMAVVATSEQPAREVLWVTGPEALPFAELAARISTAVGSPVHYVDADPVQWRAQLEAAGLPAYWADALVEMFACYRDHGPVRTDTVAELLGHPARPVDVFLRQSLAPAVATARVTDRK